MTFMEKDQLAEHDTQGTLLDMVENVHMNRISPIEVFAIKPE